MRIANRNARYVSSGSSFTQLRRTLCYLFVLVLLAGGGLGAYFVLDDLEGPVITLEPDTGRIAPGQDVKLIVNDKKSMIRSVKISVQKNNQSLVVLDRTFTVGAPSQTVSFNLKEVGIRDGAFKLEAIAHDTAFMGLGSGNKSSRTWEMRLDTQPPSIRMQSTAPALRRGSATAIAYTISEDVEKTGVQIGELFFPAFKQKNGLYYCFFAWPLHIPKAQIKPEVFAKDLAGNESRSRVLVNLYDKTFRNDTLNISDNFLDSKMPAFESLVPDANSNLERYIKMNNVIRLANEKRLQEVGQNTSPVMLWEGAFKRLPGSASRAAFGDHRTYMHNGTKIDEQTHMGQDLASLAKAPIPAGNTGKIILAEELGIFGNLVVIDHGLGLQSLYSHMSEISVAVGDTVQKGDIIGKTGTTGLAGGDHLHFGILMYGIQIQPLDWLDPKWIKNAITDRLADAAKQ